MVDMQIDGMFEISNLCLTHDVHAVIVYPVYHDLSTLTAGQGADEAE